VLANEAKNKIEANKSSCMWIIFIVIFILISIFVASIITSQV
jgi:regulatory protein YycI of two-component signal transduction system YycFG